MTDASFGTVTIGRLVLREDFIASTGNEAGGKRTLSLSGQESSPPLTAAVLKQRREDINSLGACLVPVYFTNKSDLNGYYWVDSSSADITNWTGEVIRFDWKITLEFVGPENAVDIESRLTGISRLNDFGFSGNRWHAPSIGHYAYSTGSTLPTGVLTRTGEEGAMTVYTTVPADVDPRWGCDVVDYMTGSSRVKESSLVRTGVNITLGAATWELNNALVKVTPLTSSGVFRVSSYRAGSWRDKDWNFSVGGTTGAESVGTFDACTVLRNDPEMVTLRLVKNRTPSGRVTVDLSLRRGSRFVEVYAQSDISTTMSVWLQTLETTTDNSVIGYITATADDAGGNKFSAGSARTFTVHANGGVTKTATVVLDAFLGAQVAGSSAVSGDQSVDLRNQYLRTMAEETNGVRR